MPLLILLKRKILHLPFCLRIETNVFSRVRKALFIENLFIVQLFSNFFYLPCHSSQIDQRKSNRKLSYNEELITKKNIEMYLP